MRFERFSASIILAALAVSGAAICASAQKKVSVRPLEQGAKSSAQAKKFERARYSYEFTNPAFFVSRILILHDDTGRGTVSFERKTSEEEIVEPFELSTEALQRINAHWDALRFLDSSEDYQSEKQFPHLGTIRLGLKRGERERTAEFNWSANPEAFALANEYRRAADQAIIIFEINLARENQPLETPKLLEQLERYVERRAISDARQLAPLLRDLSTDERLPLIARNRAAKILQRVEKLKEK